VVIEIEGGVVGPDDDALVRTVDETLTSLVSVVIVSPQLRWLAIAWPLSSTVIIDSFASDAVRIALYRVDECSAASLAAISSVSCFVCLRRSAHCSPLNSFMRLP
jgi:hypothetical protein